MSHKYFSVYLLLTLVINVGFLSCKKQDEFLDVAPSNHLAIPKNLNDLESILQNEGTMNNYDPSIGILSGDEYYVTPALYNAAPQVEKNAYIWASNIYPNQAVTDWLSPYTQVYFANVVLDGLGTIGVSGAEIERANEIRGAALFFRAKAFFDLVTIFSLPYDSTTANTDAGIPIRMNSDPTIVSVRSSVSECYKQIIKDLSDAAGLLPSNTARFTQPDKAVANGFLSRVYLTMGQYGKVIQSATDFLNVHSNLTDYNDISPAGVQISDDYLTEDVFHSAMFKHPIVGSTRALIDSDLIKTYETDDLRKNYYFHDYGLGGLTFVGTYDVFNRNFYSGIAIDEIYLNRAESYVRTGNVQKGMDDLNKLLAARYKTGTYQDKSISDATAALDTILLERRKELIFRSTRWTDLRRLNKETRYAKSLIRVVQNVTYTLAPDDKKYALPLPDLEVELSGLKQNAR
jgi:hypothetical protein